MAKDRIRRKLRARMGYNLFETMVTLLILSLITGGMAAGVRLASEQYRVAMVASESLVLCSTLSDRIKGYLRDAANPALDATNPKRIILDASRDEEDKIKDATSIYPYDREIWIGDNERDTDGSPLSSSNERLIPKSSYSSFGLTADVEFSPLEKDSLAFIRVKLTIYDARDKEVAETSFDVFPLN